MRYLFGFLVFGLAFAAILSILWAFWKMLILALFFQVRVGV